MCIPGAGRHSPALRGTMFDQYRTMKTIHTELGVVLFALARNRAASGHKAEFVSSLRFSTNLLTFFEIALGKAQALHPRERPILCTAIFV